MKILMWSERATDGKRVADWGYPPPQVCYSLSPGCHGYKPHWAASHLLEQKEDHLLPYHAPLYHFKKPGSERILLVLFSRTTQMKELLPVFIPPFLKSHFWICKCHTIEHCTAHVSFHWSIAAATAIMRESKHSASSAVYMETEIF